MAISYVSNLKTLIDKNTREDEYEYVNTLLQRENTKLDYPNTGITGLFRWGSGNESDLGTSVTVVYASNSPLPFHRNDITYVPKSLRSDHTISETFSFLNNDHIVRAHEAIAKVTNVTFEQATIENGLTPSLKYFAADALIKKAATSTEADKKISGFSNTKVDIGDAVISSDIYLNKDADKKVMIDANQRQVEDGTGQLITAQFEADSKGLHVLMHETLHTLGLNHPHHTQYLQNSLQSIMNVNGALMSVDDIILTSGFSDVSDTDAQYVFQSTLGMYDIAAMHLLYGVNTETNKGDTVYTISYASTDYSQGYGLSVTDTVKGSSTIDGRIVTIWDANGSDTLKIADGTTANAQIDLRSGHFSKEDFLALKDEIADFSYYETIFSSNPVLNYFDASVTTLPYKMAEYDVVLNHNVTNVLENAGVYYSQVGSNIIMNAMQNGTGGVLENAIGGDGHDSIFGNEHDNDLQGMAGHDFIRAGDGHDTITGGTGGDLLFGQGGNDTFIGDTGSNYIDGGEGFDKVDYSDFELPSNIAGTAGINYSYELEREHHPTKVVGYTAKIIRSAEVAGSTYSDILKDVEHIIGSDLDDTFNLDLYFGHFMDDGIIEAGEGFDRLNIEGGVAEFSGPAGDGPILSNEGVEYDMATGAISFVTNEEDAIAEGALNYDMTITGIDQVVASGGMDTIKAHDFGAYIYGQGGIDTIIDGAGDDHLFGGDEDDFIYSSAGGDTIDADGGTVAGEGQADTISFAKRSVSGGTGVVYNQVANLNGNYYQAIVTDRFNSQTHIQNAEYIVGSKGNDTFNRILPGDGPIWVQGSWHHSVPEFDGYEGSADKISYKDSAGVTVEQKSNAAGNYTATGTNYYKDHFKNFEIVEGSNADDVFNVRQTNGMIFDGLNGNDVLNIVDSQKTWQSLHDGKFYTATGAGGDSYIDFEVMHKADHYLMLNENMLFMGTTALSTVSLDGFSYYDLDGAVADYSNASIGLTFDLVPSLSGDSLSYDAKASSIGTGRAPYNASAIVGTNKGDTFNISTFELSSNYLPIYLGNGDDQVNITHTNPGFAVNNPAVDVFHYRGGDDIIEYINPENSDFVSEFRVWKGITKEDVSSVSYYNEYTDGIHNYYSVEIEFSKGANNSGNSLSIENISTKHMPMFSLEFDAGGRIDLAWGNTSYVPTGTTYYHPVLEGTFGEDYFEVESGKTYYGLGGDDQFEIKVGPIGVNNSTIYGGAGFDIADFADVSYDMVIELKSYSTDNNGVVQRVENDQIDTVLHADGTETYLSNIEKILVGQSSTVGIRGSRFDDKVFMQINMEAYDGGEGVDTASYEDATSAVNVNLATGLATGASIGVDTLTSIEHAIGSNYDDTLTAGTDDTTLTGGLGADQFIFGSAGHNYITDFNLVENDTLDLGMLFSYDQDVSASYNDYIQLTETADDTIISVDIDGAGIASAFVNVVTLFNTTGLGTVTSLINAGRLLALPPNPEPVAETDDFMGTEDQIVTGNVLVDNGHGVDADPENETLSVVAETVTSEHGGTIIISENGDFTYTPAADHNGADSFTYQLQDVVGNIVTGMVNITLSAVNDAPIANDDTFVAVENTAFTGDLLLNDVDVDGDVLTVTAQTLTTSQGATVTMTSDGNFTYTPATDYLGADSFDYQIQDAEGITSTATANITVSDAPVANDDAFVVDEDVVLSGNVLTNDTGANGNPIVIAETLTTDQGGAVIITADGNFTYTPATDYNGADSFVYQIENADGLTSTATVNITVNAVNDAPVANDDTFTTDEDTALSGNLLVNDTDVETTPTAVTQTIATSQGGTVTISENGDFTYTPAANYNGADSFDYQVQDAEGLTSSATASITVNAVNDAPVANDDTFTVEEDTVLSGNLLANDTDTETALTAVAQTIATSQGGTVTIFANGDFTYSPAANYNGADSFDYQIQDAEGLSSTATASITVNAVNDAPEAADDLVDVTQNQPMSGNLFQDNGNGVDSDIDLDTLSTIAGTYATVQGGSVVILANGDFTYTPSTDFIGQDSFVYTLNDGQGGTDTATLTLDVAASGTSIIVGTAANESLTGDAGENTIIGQEGNDTLYGQDGNDTYVWNTGDGFDTIFDTAGLDQILFGENISIEDVRLINPNSGNLDIYVNDVKVITINDHFDNTGEEVEKIVFDNGDELSLIGDLTFTGTNAADSLRGTDAGNDTLIGLAGHDKLYGYSGDDIFIGGTGNDKLYGEAGNDTYIWNIGDGENTIYDTAGIDQIQFGANINVSDIRLSNINNGNLDIYVNDVKAFIITDHFDGAGGEVEKIVFHNGEELSLIAGLTVTGTSAVDSVYGTSHDDTLIGGAGNDQLHGLAGDDTYLWNIGDGINIIHDSAGVDKIQFGANIVITDIRLGNINGGNLDIYVNDVKAFTINDHFDNTGEEVEKIVFENGDEMLLTGDLTFTGDYLANNLYGTDTTNDTLKGAGGHDKLYGLGGDDTLIGEAGNDNLYGAAGNDTYVWNIGDGENTIYETTGMDKILFGPDITLSDVRLVNINDGDLRVYVHNEEAFIINNHFAGTGEEVEKIVFDNGDEISLTSGLTITGGAATESLYGTDNNDVIIGEAGTNTLYGLGGDDTYVWNLGDGHNMIHDSAGIDKIQFGSGISMNDIRLGNINNGNLTVYVGTTLAFTIYDHFDALGKEVEKIVFDNGDEISLIGDLTFVGSSSAETLYGTNTGNDTLIGGAGNDKLYGLGGNDTYVWNIGDGHEVLYESGGSDLIELGAGVELADIRLENINNGNLMIHINGTKSITINDHFDTIGEAVEKIVLDDNSEISLTSGLTLTGNQYSNRMYGTEHSDTLIAGAGTDRLYGLGGDDILFAEASDYLYGGDGADTFVMTEVANNNIYDFDLAEGDILDLSDLLTDYDAGTDALSDFLEITEASSYSKVYVDIDGAGSAHNMTQVTYLVGVTGMTDESSLVTNGQLIVT